MFVIPIGNRLIVIKLSVLIVINVMVYSYLLDIFFRYNKNILVFVELHQGLRFTMNMHIEKKNFLSKRQKLNQFKRYHALLESHSENKEFIWGDENLN